MTDSGIGLGIIGCGDVALRTYGPGLAPLAGRATAVSVYDPDPVRAECLAEDLVALGLPRPTIAPTFDALLADQRVAAVLNLTPAPFHHEVNVAALQAGRHVFSEKPLARTVADARAAIDLARERGLTLGDGNEPFPLVESEARLGLARPTDVGDWADGEHGSRGLARLQG